MEPLPNLLIIKVEKNMMNKQKFKHPNGVF